jgi:hypothetical protein
MDTQVNAIPTGEGLTFEKVWLMFQATDRIIKENAERQKETDRQLKEYYAEMRRDRKRQDKDMGDLSRRFGELAVHLVAPDIEDKFNDMEGYHLSVTGLGRTFLGVDGKKDADADIFLENDRFNVVVEVKAKVVEKDIRDHLERLETIRAYNERYGDPRKVRGAIAGAIFPENLRRETLKAGLYVIVQTGDTVKIDVPPDWTPKEW